MLLLLLLLLLIDSIQRAFDFKQHAIVLFMSPMTFERLIDEGFWNLFGNRFKNLFENLKPVWKPVWKPVRVASVKFDGSEQRGQKSVSRGKIQRIF